LIGDLTPFIHALTMKVFSFTNHVFAFNFFKVWSSNVIQQQNLNNFPLKQISFKNKMI